MNILHLSTARTWRGGEQQIVNLYKGLQNHIPSVQQHIICTKNSAMHRYCQHHHLSHFPLTKAAPFNPLFAYHLWRISRRTNAHLIHCHDPHAQQFATIAADIFGNFVPIVLSRRVDFPIQNNWYSYYKYNHPQIKRIICVSDAIRQIITPTIRQSEKVCTVHSGIDFDRFDTATPNAASNLRQQYQIPAATLLIGNVAALADHKDYFTFIDTAQILLEAGLNAVFLAIGEGEQRQVLQQYAQTKGVTDRLIFTGFRADIPQILPQLNLQLVTSKTEGLGTAVADAMYCRIPVVATAAGGIPELIEHGKTGLLAPVQDAPALAKHVQQLLQQKAWQQSMIDNAYRKVVEHFSLQSMAKKTWQVYAEVVPDIR
jgi:glycosyltransferase involved in cell wall biosynthesis